MGRETRIAWVDNAKGYAMILVLLGHMQILSLVNACIYSFHMPLFFFLSGYLLNAKGKSFKNYVCHKANRIIKPLMIYSVITVIFEYVYSYKILHNITYQEIVNQIMGIIVEAADGKYRSAFWFLPCIFFAQILYYAVKKISGNKGNTIVIIVVLILGECVNYLGTRYAFVRELPWALYNVLLALFMMLIGEKYREKEAIMNQRQYMYVCIETVVFLASMSANYYYNGTISLYGNQGNMILAIIESVTGTLLTVQLFQRLKGSKILEYIGKNSIFFYCTQFMVFSAPNILFYNILKVDFEKLSYIKNIILNASYLFITIISIVVLNEIKNGLVKRAKKLID